MKALVAMSGGVDSSVAAAMMLERGFDVIGVTLKQWQGADGEMPTAGCCTVADAEDARHAAAQLDIPYYVLDYVAEFTDAVVSRFGAGYLRGETPNPCVECNRRVRFNALLDRTSQLGCDVLVTGHHARIDRSEGHHRLLTAVDATKDQSYVLYTLGQAELERIALPVGEITKAEVRERAAGYGLRTADKPDSQDICFVGNGDYRDFLLEHFPAAAQPGTIVDTAGTVLAEHGGTAEFTIGQRKGLGVALGEPRYVIDIEPRTATVTIGRKEDLLVTGCILTDTNLIAGGVEPPAEVEIKVRYRTMAVPAKVAAVDEATWEVLFDAPQHGVAPGQAGVLYQGDEVVGGGTIAAPLR